MGESGDFGDDNDLVDDAGDGGSGTVRGSFSERGSGNGAVFASIAGGVG